MELQSLMLLFVSLSISCFFTLTQGFNLEAPADGFLKREYSLTKPYSGNGMNIPNWHFRDFVMISNNFIRLTQDAQGQRGSIWSQVQCHMHDWEMHVHYKIYGSARTLAADGMAFWYTKSKMSPGSVFGSSDEFTGLGVFLDTYKNGNQPVSFPQVSAMLGNGSIKYDHDNDNKKTSVGSCLTSFRNKQHDTVMKIRYSRETLVVQFDNHDEGEWRDCIKIENIKLPTGYFFGFSAATGDLADFHEIIGIKVYELSIPRTEDEQENWAEVKPSIFKSPLDNRDDDSTGAYRNQSPSGFKLFLWIVFVIIAIGVCGLAGYFVVQKRQESNMKRFY